jgi:hypothetical protein
VKPEEAVGLARVVIDKYGADADKPSVHLAKALLDGAHERDRLRARVSILESALSEALAIAEWEASEYLGKPEHLVRLPQLRDVLSRKEPSP